MTEIATELVDRSQDERKDIAAASLSVTPPEDADYPSQTQSSHERTLDKPEAQNTGDDDHPDGGLRAWLIVLGVRTGTFLHRKPRNETNILSSRDSAVPFARTSRRELYWRVLAERLDLQLWVRERVGSESGVSRLSRPKC